MESSAILFKFLYYRTILIIGEIMSAPKIYLKTTMFSFYWEERQNGDYPEFKTQARSIFDLIKVGEYEPYTSLIALQEIAREPNPKKREKMAALVVDYNIKILDESDEANRIAFLYVQEYINLRRYWNSMKTIQEYMNDPRMLNDPAMAVALEPVKEIHAIRLMIQDETIGMSVMEKAAYNKRDAEVLFTSLGMSAPEYVNLTGNGKLKPRVVATS